MSLSEGTRGEGVLLHTAAIVAEDFAFLTQVLRVLLTLVGYVQAIRLLQRALERGRENMRIGDSRDECVLQHTHTQPITLLSSRCCFGAAFNSARFHSQCFSQ